MTSPTALAIDLGSSSGRVIAGTLRDGRIEESEVHRFPHEARMMDGVLSWDIELIWDEIVRGLGEAVRRFPDASSVSVDTWGVDFALLDGSDRLVMPAGCYRDERTTRTNDEFRAALDDDEVWRLTGIAPATINSANQLFALLHENPSKAERVERALFLPDYFTYLLSGSVGWSRSIASTSALCFPGADRFNDEVFAKLGIPREWFGEVTAEHSLAEGCRLPGLEQLDVIRAGAHDTTCAVQALQRDESQETNFLSCGSWSVLGVLRDEPLLDPAAHELGVTNEARAAKGVRPLFNITGLWILQECQRQWRAAGLSHGIVELVGMAEAAPSLGVYIDPDEPQFGFPGDMLGRIAESVAAQGVSLDVEDQGAVIRVILESLARRYAHGVESFAALTGRTATQLNMFGGGSRNDLLVQLTADAVGVPVTVGPTEASSLGSLLVQHEVAGRISHGERNDVIAASADGRTVTPR